MAGLLDSLDDTAVVGLLSAGLRMMSTPGPFGQVLGQAGMGALGDMNAAKDSLQKRKLQEQQMKAADIQMLMHQQQLADMQRQSQQQTQAQEFLRTVPSPQMAAAQGALAGGGGPTVANAAKMPAVDPQQAMAFKLMQAGLLQPAAYLAMLQKDETPLTVKEGENLVDRKTFKPVFQAKPKEDDFIKNMRAAGIVEGSPQWVQLLTEKAKKDATHAPPVSVVMNTEKGYAGEMAQGLAKQDLALIDAARTAPDRVRSAMDVKRILTTERPITGTAADQRLWAEKALSTAGFINGRDVKSTEDLSSLLAGQTLDAIKSSGLGSGQGFTNQDREFLQDAKSGRIQTNPGTLLRLADLNERAARASIVAGNKVAARLKSNPQFGGVGQDLETPMPNEIRLPTADEIRAEAQRRAKSRGQ